MCILFQAVFVFNLIQYAPLTYDKYKYPAWADGLGWILSLFPLIWLAGSMIWKITTVKGEMTALEVRRILFGVFLSLDHPKQLFLLNVTNSQGSRWALTVGRSDLSLQAN